MLTVLLAIGLCLSVKQLGAQKALPAQPDAATIMARVAANQDHSVTERSHYIYVQHARVISRKSNTVRCEEITDSRVVPTASGSTQHLLKLNGRLLIKNHYITYDHLSDPKDAGNTNVDSDSDTLNINLDNNGSMDRDLVENMRQNLIASRSKDGIGAGLFPLTTTMQADYDFRLVGRETLNGRQVFHLTFQPKDASAFGWKGDAYIDTQAFEPVVVRTAMSRKIPFAVRTLLGTSLPGLGFTVIYSPQPGGVWFPTSFGTEFKLHVLFFFHREIIVDADNHDFEQTHVKSTIVEPGPSVTAKSQP